MCPLFSTSNHTRNVRNDRLHFLFSDKSLNFAGENERYTNEKNSVDTRRSRLDRKYVCMYRGGGDTLSITYRSKDNYCFQRKRIILPATFIGVGSLAMAPTFLRNGDHSLTNSVMDLRGHTKADDYLQYLPVVSSLALGLTGVKARHNLRDRTLITGVSYATMAILVNVPKNLIHECRPDGGTRSFPSGHTATAFMGAELTRIEYGGWPYGAVAYTVAAGIGFLRVYNGRHWFHDVVAGAGVGILSARFGECSYKWWGKLFDKKIKGDLLITPMTTPVGGGYYGFSVVGCF